MGITTLGAERATNPFLAELAAERRVSRKAQAPKGTFDILPADSRARERVESAAAQVFERAGFGRIETPDLRGHRALSPLGRRDARTSSRRRCSPSTTSAGRSITLRPEGTAAVCRAYVEHGMHKLAQPVKLWYSGPFFRYEAPQAGRYRQFHQIGAETIGSDDPLADAESIMLLSDLLAELEVPGVKLHLASLGSPDARAEYRDELRAYLREHSGRGLAATFGPGSTPTRCGRSTPRTSRRSA